MSNLITPKGGWAGREIQTDANAEITETAKTNAGMFCPNCRAEYRPGFATCSDCNVALVTEEVLSSLLGGGEPTISSAANKRTRRKGQLECPKCGMESDIRAKRCPGCGHIFGLLNLSTPHQVEVPLALKCVQHPQIDAIARCRGCSSGICSTCDFEVSAGLHFCPKCIDNASDETISSRRKSFAIGALVAAIYCTALGIFTFSGALYRTMGGPGNEHALSVFIMYGLYVPSVIGTALGFCAFERRLKNTPFVWTALIWSGALTAIFIVVEIAFRVMR